MKKSYHSTVVPMQDAIAIRRIIAGDVAPVVFWSSMSSSRRAVSRPLRSVVGYQLVRVPSSSRATGR